jgi:hypothetical protein
MAKLLLCPARLFDTPKEESSVGRVRQLKEGGRCALQ